MKGFFIIILVVAVMMCSCTTHRLFSIRNVSTDSSFLSDIVAVGTRERTEGEKTAVSGVSQKIYTYYPDDTIKGEKGRIYAVTTYYYGSRDIERVESVGDMRVKSVATAVQVDSVTRERERTAVPSIGRGGKWLIWAVVVLSLVCQGYRIYKYHRKN